MNTPGFQALRHIRYPEIAWVVNELPDDGRELCFATPQGDLLVIPFEKESADKLAAALREPKITIAKPGAVPAPPRPSDRS